MSSPSEDPVRVILLLMIKNESRIIRRSILSALPIADAVCVSDTGSTDDTVQVLEEFYPMLKMPAETPSLSLPEGEGTSSWTQLTSDKIPAKTYQHSWKNFGANRSLSFIDAQQFCQSLGWNPARTYALAIDADMELVKESGFNKQADLSLKGYNVIQKAGSLHYANTRLMRLDVPWTCIGATHEYWNGPMESTLSDSKLWINDKNDGGCKADKYPRDRILLEQELVEQPTNVRTHFYLAQTYKCLGLHDLSIDMYKKRIELGGWFEEVWYSHYMIAQQYLNSGRQEDAELWVLKGQKYNSYRAESLYLLVKHFRIIGQQWKAMHYYYEAKKIQKPTVALFLESEVYDHLLDYEYTVLQYYVNKADKSEGLRACTRYLLHPKCGHVLENVVSNIEFYLQPLLAMDVTPVQTLPSIGDLKPSSVSVTLHKGEKITNVRYVNYHTSEKGVYTARDPENIVRTQNLRLGAGQFIQEDSAIPSIATNIMGNEDIRLFSDGSSVLYTAASKSCNLNKNYRIVMGTYDVSANVLKDSRVLEPPQGIHSGCEKNWLMIPSQEQNQTQQSPLVIYQWSPLTICSIPESSNHLSVLHRHSVPPYFSKFRGSANGILFRDAIWCLAHVVKYGDPRKYYHHLVVLNKDTYKPERISVPFCFQRVGIEYCLSFQCNSEDNTATFYFSSFDADPKEMVVPLATIEFVNV